MLEKQNAFWILSFVVGLAIANAHEKSEKTHVHLGKSLQNNPCQKRR